MDVSATAGRLVGAVAFAAAAEAGIRAVAPIPWAPAAFDLAFGLALYAAAAAPAFLALALGWPRLAAWLAGAPFALLAANLAFGFGTHSYGVVGVVVAGCFVAGAVTTATIPARGLAGAVIGCLLLVALHFGRAPRIADATEPSVLLVVLDTTAASHLSAYGYARPTSPALAAFASTGTLYQRAVATAPWTLPSHASIFTGRYPSALGFDGGDLHPRGPVGSVARDLAATGRATAAISANPIVPAVDGLRDGFAAAWAADRLTRPALLRLLDRHRWRGDFQSEGARVTTLALDWIDRLAPRGRPWFLFVNYSDPHAPYRPPRAEHDTFAPGVDPNAVAAEVQLYNAGVLPLTPTVTAAMRSLYDGEVAAMDAAFARLLHGLAARGWDARRLLVIVVADHGECLGEHGFVGHLLGMPDSVLRVPLVLSGLDVPVTTIDDPVQPVQIRATVRKLLGLPEAPEIAPPLPPWGPAPSLLVSESPEPRWYFDELHEFNDALASAAWRGDWVAVEHAGQKVVFDASGRGSTYDLRVDPDEQKPGPLTDGVALIRSYTALRALQELPFGGEPSERTRRALQEIGYLR